MPTFSPPRNPTYGYNRKRKPKMLMAEFGDGYAQRAGDGINNNPRTLSLNWGMLSKTEMEAIIAFFDTRSEDASSFDYTLPDETSSKKYIVTEYEDVHDEYDNYEVKAKFQEVFEP